MVLPWCPIHLLALCAIYAAAITVIIYDEECAFPFELLKEHAQRKRIRLVIGNSSLSGTLVLSEQT